MRRTRALPLVALTALSGLVAAMLTVSPPAVADPRFDPPPGLSIAADKAARRLLDEVHGKAAISVDAATGVAGALRLASPPAAGSGSARAVARAFLAEHGALFGVGATTTLVAAGEVPDGAGGTVVGFEQRFRGLPVFGGAVKVRLDASNAVTSVHAVVVPSLDLSTDAALTSSEVAAAARRSVREHGDTGGSLSTGKPRLMIFREGMLEGAPGANRLAYEVEVSGAQGGGDLLYLDAGTGRTLQRVEVDQHALDRRVYERGTTDADVVFREGDPDPIPLTAENAALVGSWQRLASSAKETYNFFRSMALRDSYDGAGATMRSVARSNDIAFLCPNATWNGAVTSFCEGMDADDIASHEWGHAYTGSTSGLVYAWQSGALNESYSDVWGEAVDLLNARGTDGQPVRPSETCSEATGGTGGASVRWLMGEDATAFSQPMRDMWHPGCLGLPGKVGSKEYIVPGDGWDSGGVHINSSVPNHAFALLTDGGLYDDYIVRGLGLTKTANLWWNAGLLLTPTSRFPAFADALETACAALTTRPGLLAPRTSSPSPSPTFDRMTSADCVEVGVAIEAVQLRRNVSDPTNPGPVSPYLESPSPERCPEGPTTTYGGDDFEAETTDWVAGHRENFWGVYYQPDWALTTTFPAGAPTGSTRVAYKAMITRGYENDGIYSFDSQAYTMPEEEGVRLSFDHWFFTGRTIFGGVARGGNVKISVDDGPWTLVPASAFLHNAYNARNLGDSDPDDDYVPPMASEPIFSNTDDNQARAAWASSRIDLGALTDPGDEVRFRLDFVQDYNHFNIPAGAGWYVDNVSIYSCSDDVAPVASPRHFGAPNASGWNSEPVEIRWRWNDAGSGIDPDSCTRSTTVSVEGVATHEATCTDAVGNIGTASHEVKLDRTAPVIVGPTVTPARVVQGLQAQGSFGASDSLSGIASRTCQPTFAVSTASVGTFSVLCSATNGAGLGRGASTSYTVVTASQGIADLIAQVKALGLAKNAEKSLISILENAQKNRDRRNDADCVTQLSSFISQVQAQSGKSIPAAGAAALIATARGLIEAIRVVPS